MALRVLAFARLRELVGAGARDLELADGATVAEAWSALAAGAAELTQHRASTRFARNGVLTDPGTVLHDGDEVALLPPVGGG